MEVILTYLPLLLPLLAGVVACAVLAARTRFVLLCSLIQGALALFAFGFLIFMGATLNELLLTLLVLLLPSTFSYKRRKP